MADAINPITVARERAERWLEQLDVERDRTVRLIADLRQMEHDPAMLFRKRPARAVLVLPELRRAIRAQQ